MPKAQKSTAAFHRKSRNESAIMRRSDLGSQASSYAALCSDADRRARNPECQRRRKAPPPSIENREMNRRSCAGPISDLKLRHTQRFVVMPIDAREIQNAKGAEKHRRLP